MDDAVLRRTPKALHPRPWIMLDILAMLCKQRVTARDQVTLKRQAWAFMPLHAHRRPILLPTCPNSLASRAWLPQLRLRGRDCPDLPEQAERVPVDPLFHELAIDNVTEELAVDIDRLTGGRGALQLSAVVSA